MTLIVNGVTYAVELNGSDYVTQAEPNPADFVGVFDVTVDGEVEKDMTLAGIQQLDDGWHISIYRQTEDERRNLALENEITDLQAALAEVYEMILV